MKFIFKIIQCICIVGCIFSYGYTAKRGRQPCTLFPPKVICKFFDAAMLEQRSAAGLNDVIWEKKETVPFDEIIVSWNAFRPLKGDMTIWVSVRLKNSGWSPWHRFAKWSATSQRTFVNKLSRYVHTKNSRIEMQRGVLAHGFRVKVSFQNGARPQNLKALFACLTRLKKFKRTVPNTKLPSVCVHGLPKQSQMVLRHEDYRDLCSPTSTSMLVAYFYKQLYNNKFSARSLADFAAEFADKVYDHGIHIYGNWILNVAEAFNSCNGEVFFRVERLSGFNDLHRYLSKNIPVAVSVRRLRGGATPYANGHFLIPFAYSREKQQILCMDPAFVGRRVVKRYPLRSFLAAWARSSNMTYVPATVQQLRLAIKDKKLSTALLDSSQQIDSQVGCGSALAA